MGEQLFGANLFQFDDFEAIRHLIPTVQQNTVSYRPLKSVLGEPINLLHCDKAESIIAFRGLGGKWSMITAKAGTPEANRMYSVRLAALGIKSANLFLLKDGEVIGEVKTNEDGKALFQLPTLTPTTGEFTVSLFKEPPTPLGFPPNTTDGFLFTLWQVICLIKNKSDVWWRFAGRAWNETLPRSFWSVQSDSKSILHTIGLAAPFGEQRFIDFIPIFGDMEVSLEYGISAYCNTKNPSPSPEECLAARKETWWEFKIVAFNGKEKQTITGDLNIDRHLKATLTPQSLTGSIITPAGANT